MDGNKRIAFIAIVLFLRLNGFRPVASNADAAATILRLAAGELAEADLAAWIAAHLSAGAP